MIEHISTFVATITGLAGIIGVYYSPFFIRLEEFENKIVFIELKAQTDFSTVLGEFFQSLSIGLFFPTAGSSIYQDFIIKEQQHWNKIFELQYLRNVYTFWYKIPVYIFCIMFVIVFYLIVGESLNLNTVKEIFFRIVVWTLIGVSSIILFYAHYRLATIYKQLKRIK